MNGESGVVLEVLIPVLRLFLLTIGGFIVFKIDWVRKHLLKPFVWLIMNVVFPLYFVHSLPTQWSEGAKTGWLWAGIFFAAYLVYVLIQVGMSRLLMNRTPLTRTDQPREFLVMFTMHNAGYIPLPIVAALTPAVVSLYIKFYALGFMLLFFTVAVWIIQGGAEAARSASESGSGGPTAAARGAAGRIRFRPNAPMVGIAIGVILAVTGLYLRLPPAVQAPFRFASTIALDAVMVVLGAVLASIPGKSMKFRREYVGYVIAKMIIFPLVVLGILLLIPMRSLDPAIASGIKLALVLEAAVPPATNIVIISKAYGTPEQVEYAAGAVVYTYIAALVIIPVFLVVSRLVFG